MISFRKFALTEAALVVPGKVLKIKKLRDIFLCSLHTSFILRIGSVTKSPSSIGLGFKFKPVENQIDVNYYIGSRNYPSYNEQELAQQFQIGISLADLWFVRRRQK